MNTFMIERALNCYRGKRKDITGQTEALNQEKKKKQLVYVKLGEC